MSAAVMTLLSLLCRDEARWKHWPTAYISFRVTLSLSRPQRASIILKGLQIGFQKPKRCLRVPRINAR
jgi:hypothetical protein